VNHAGIPATLVQCGSGLLFDDQDVDSFSRQMERSTDSDGAGTDDHDFYLGHSSIRLAE
jgi:hypothetical protein